MAIALIANVAKTSGGTTGAIDTTGANFLVAVAGYLASGASSTHLPGFSDSKGNTWYAVSPLSNNNGAVAFFVAYNPTVGSGHTFTCTGGLPSFCVAAFSGVHLSFAVGVAPQAGGTVNSLQPGSITPSLDNCLLVAGLGYRDTTTVSVDSGYTITDQNPFNSGVAVGSALAYLIQTTATAKNPTFSWTNVAIANAQQIVVREPDPVGSSFPIVVTTPAVFQARQTAGY